MQDNIINRGLKTKEISSEVMGKLQISSAGRHVESEGLSGFKKRKSKLSEGNDDYYVPSNVLIHGLPTKLPPLQKAKSSHHSST